MKSPCLVQLQVLQCCNSRIVSTRTEVHVHVVAYPDKQQKITPSFPLPGFLLSFLPPPSFPPPSLPFPLSSLPPSLTPLPPSSLLPLQATLLLYLLMKCNFEYFKGHGFVRTYLQVSDHDAYQSLRTAHTEWLPGVRLKPSAPAVHHIGDCEAWWLSDCRSSVVEHGNSSQVS